MPHHVGNIAVSDAGLATAAAVLYALGQRYGSSVLVWTYVLPWMWVNHWIGESLLVLHAARTPRRRQGLEAEKDTCSYDHLPPPHLTLSPKVRPRVLDVPAGRTGDCRPEPGPCAPVYVPPHCRLARGAPLVPVRCHCTFGTDTLSVSRLGSQRERDA